MNIKDIISQIVYIIITMILPILLTYIVMLIRKKTKELTEKIKNDYMKDTINKATEIVTEAVLVVNQTYVDSLKSNGNFTKESQAIALSKAIDISNSLMNNEIKEFITKEYTDLNQWIINKIEYTIKQSKVN